MKKLSIFFLLIIPFFVKAQIDDPYNESPVALKANVRCLGGGVYELIITANIEPDWCMYSQNLPKGGPFPTTIAFEKNPGFELIGKPKEDSKHKKVVEDELFNLELTKYYDSVLFKQIVVLKDEKVKKIQADVGFMTCNAQTCLPPIQEKVEFFLN